MFISPHCVIFPFVFVSILLIIVDMLGVTLVGDFIIYLRRKALQNSRYFLLQMVFYFCLLLCSYFLFLILNYFDISLNSGPLVYAFLRLTYLASSNYLVVFVETLFDLEVYTQFQQ